MKKGGSSKIANSSRPRCRPLAARFAKPRNTRRSNSPNRTGEPPGSPVFTDKKSRTPCGFSSQQRKNLRPNPPEKPATRLRRTR